MFLGGWLSPFPLAVASRSACRGSPRRASGWLLVKLFLVVSCFLWFRATFPRYRYDQIMRLGWKVFIPVTLVVDRRARRLDADAAVGMVAMP